MSPVSDQQAARRHIDAWNVGLNAAQDQHITLLGQALQQALSTQPQAWLVFDGWEDSPAAAWLQAAYPAWAEERRTLADPALRGLEGVAPCLLPLHRWAEHEADAQRREHTLRDLLALMWLDTQRRLVRQHLCGVVLMPDDAQDLEALFDHWLLLGRQVAPDGQGRVPFRHFDPRSLQRVWPSLSAAQRATLLGPAHSVWQLQAPWGPWAAADLEKDGDHYLPDPESLLGTPPQWHVAQRPTGTDGAAPAPVAVHRLLGAAQIQLLANLPAAQMCWQTMALLAVPVPLQPSAAAMRNMCDLMQAWRNQHPTPWSDTHARDWLWCTWFGADIRHPARGSGEQAVHWGQAPWSARAVKLAQALNDEPGLSLRQHFEDILNADAAPNRASATAPSAV